jgi:hypothetical protein
MPIFNLTIRNYEKNLFIISIHLFVPVRRTSGHTTNPEATLDVNGDLIVRTAVIAAPAANYNLLSLQRTL